MQAVTRFDKYIQSLGIPIYGISGSGLKAVINFKPEATYEQIETANAARATFDWIDRREPDPVGFMRLVAKACGDGTLPVAAGPYLNMFAAYTGAEDHEERKKLWAKIKQQLTPTQQLITIVENGAAQFDMPLV